MKDGLAQNAPNRYDDRVILKTNANEEEKKKEIRRENIMNNLL